MDSESGFNFTAKMRILCDELVARLPELCHIDLRHVAFAFSQARNRSAYGTYATLTPMRFEDGSLYTIRRGHRYTVRRLYNADGTELFYIVTFYMPRFMDVDLVEKLSTVIHELWHISPEFNGDIRRYSGRCYAHSSSQDEYDAEMDRMAVRWLESKPPEPIYGFLRYRFDELVKNHGPIYGAKIKHPKLVRCA
jgi:hypothetical protein